jgi:hypothetical protein
LPIAFGPYNVTRGSNWYFGTDDPTFVLGSPGDYYLETDTGNIWTKAGASWSVIDNIIGPQGPQGPEGPEGAANMTAGPEGPQGPEGDPGPNFISIYTDTNITGILPIL